MKLIEKQLGRTDIYKGRIIEVAVDDVELENGAKSKRELVMHPGGVCVAALTGQDEMLFVRQFRYPYQEVVLEAPAGKLERGEDPFEAVSYTHLCPPICANNSPTGISGPNNRRGNGGTIDA